jgi:ABC-type amino acid transport substrate-binding protein
MPGSIRNRRMLAATVASCFIVAGATFAQTQSAAPAAPANPNSAIRSGTPATPASPMQSATPSSSANPIQSTTPPTPANPIQSTTPMANPNLSSSPIQMPGAIPSKSETMGSAFEKLSSSQQYVTRDEAGKLDGFDRAFAEADRDKDGRLNQEEFAVAWAIYTGRT